MKKKYREFMEDGDFKEQDFSVDVTRDFLPSREHREVLLEKLRAAVPKLTAHQKAVLGLLSQGNTFEEIAHELKITKGAVQTAITAIRKKV